jgi:hypothetical protein
MPIGNPRWPPPQYIDSHWTLWENVQMPSSQKLQILLKPNYTWVQCESMYCGGGHLGFPIDIKNSNFVEALYADRKFKMAATAGHRITLDPMGKCSNAFFSETTDMIKVSEKKRFETIFP